MPEWAPKIESRPGSVPAAAVPPAAPKEARPPTPRPAASTTGAWSVVEQKPAGPDALVRRPSAEDKSYAEWFSWAKRGGAPAKACHAAAQAAFQALQAGHDIATAVKWATEAMTKPPLAVDSHRQTYCAWFALANIDLNLKTPRAHVFATAAVHALDATGDAKAAHEAGMAALKAFEPGTLPPKP